MTAKSLFLWGEGIRMGELSMDKGLWKFRYADEWLAHEGRFPLSPHFPLRGEDFSDNSEERPVQWFFDNLLPEGGVRQALARYAGMADRDSFGLLERFGEESAGALTLLPEGKPFPSDARYELISIDELRALLHKQAQIPLIAAAGKAKMSLAGAQHKLPLRWDGESFWLPIGAASSHILKPENARPKDYPFCPANEHFCMALARATGLSAPKTSLLHLPEPVTIVERYDRVILDGQVRRLHQIDLCQALNKWPTYKYESEGGATFREAFESLDGTRQPAAAKNRLLRWFVFNYIVGNSDAHAKNVSFLVRPDGLDIAPFYDLLCAKVYGDDSMAMTIGDEARYGWVTEAAWDALAGSIGIPKTVLRRIRMELAKELPAKAKTLIARPEFNDDERQFLLKVLAIIEDQAGEMGS